MCTFAKVREDQIEPMFPGCVPCDCNNNLSKGYQITKYDVKFTFGKADYGIRRGKIISEITVTCNCCGTEKSYDVDALNICKNDVTW